MAKVYDLTGKEVGEIELNAEVFGREFNPGLVHQAVVMQMAAMRQGTSSTKKRGEVRGGGRKPWRQKGTGHARCGSIRSSIWVGGGVTFGPKPRSYAKAMPRKMRRAAIACSLSSKVAADELVVVENVKFDVIKTKQAVAVVKAFDAVDKKVLFITVEGNTNVEKSAANMPKVKVITNMGLNCMDILNANKIILDKAVIPAIEEVLG
ncbi:MAG: 50S ribosomal protein L4 [Acidaminococcaceae bacterium]|nr:50S ribosomal protein L4 [Acidaminococcaceae bacterium]